MDKKQKEQSMNVERLFISPKKRAEQIDCDSVTVQIGMGIKGDRNFGKNKHPGQNITLIEVEEIELFCQEHSRIVDLSLMRRNIVTRGVKLNELIDVEFSIGSVRLRGVELCEPCVVVGNMLRSDSLSKAGVIKHWIKRGGLRADVLTDGEIVLRAPIHI
jgi:MOSC domain-containing protein YiiM